MLKLILGEKGKGKTKYLLENANAEAKTADGVVIYLDNSSEHMFQLDKEVRLINVKEYPVADVNVLLGFVCGLKSGNNDIESIYFDSFLSLSSIEKSDLEITLRKLVILSDKLDVKFTVSISVNESDIPEEFKEFIAVAL